MSQSVKKILLISYHFPPSTAIGGMRIASFAKYLFAEGWKPYVLTVKDDYLNKKDTSRLNSLKGVTIFKAGKLITLRDIYLKAKLFLAQWIGGRKNMLDPTATSSVKSATIIKNKKDKIKHLIASFVLLPDADRNWIIPATYKALCILQREKIDYILTSSPPYSVHMVGLLTAMLKPEIKWIADFRDPWMVPNEKRSIPTTSFSKYIDYHLEKYVIHRADMVLTTTGILSKTFINYYSECKASKFKLVPNGFDEDGISSIDEKRYSIFTISYTGVLYAGRNPESVFQAISSLIKHNKIASSEICLKLVGNCRNIEGIPTSKIISRYELESVVELIDMLPYAEAQQIIKQSHVALLLAPNQKYQIPAKAYDYIGLRTPILALTGEGATAELINSVNTGKVIHSDDICGIENFILDQINREALPKLKDNYISQHTRKRAVQKLVYYMQELDLS